jgi:hypothetical protein
MERTPHLTQGQAPDLARCIANTHIGQAAWAGWHAPKETCGDCRFFDRGKHGKPKAICLKHQALDFPKHRKGKPIPATARACRFWERRE